MQFLAGLIVGALFSTTVLSVSSTALDAAQTILGQ